HGRMVFTPSEIKNKTFTRVKTGLEPTEVESYLEQLSNEIERLKEDKAQLEKVIEDKETNIQSYKDVHQSVSDALIQAKQAGEETKEAANKEADRSEEHTSELQSRFDLVCRLLLENK